MAIYVLKPFDRNFKGDMIADIKLCLAARELIAGQYEASLGVVFTKNAFRSAPAKAAEPERLSRSNHKNTCFLLTVTLNRPRRVAYVRLTREDELNLYRQVASQLFAMTTEQERAAIKARKMREVICDG